MYKLTQTTNDGTNTVVINLGTFDELDDARRFMYSEYYDGFKSEVEWGARPIGNIGDFHAVIKYGDLYEESRWKITETA